MDLVDFSTTFPEENQPYKWLLVYQDHFTKFVRMHALKTKTAEEVAEVLMDIFWDMGAPTILQSDNGRELENEILLNYLNRYWSSSKIIHGKPRHPQTQGSVESANKDIKSHFTALLYERQSTCWIEHLKEVQYLKNTSYHSGLGMSPFQAVFNANLP